MAFRVGIADFGDSWSAVAFGLPGCAANAPTRDTVRAMLPVAIGEHLAWLCRAGEPVDVSAPIEFDIIEEVVVATLEGVADGEFCFEDDLRPLTNSEIDDALRLMVASRADLLRSVDGLPDDVLDWRPPASAMARLDEWKPAPLTIREIVADVGGAESYYRRALRGSDEPDTEVETSDAPLQRERLVEVLRGLPSGDRGPVFTRRLPWQTEGEEHWTARKVVRRVISHERFHTAEVQQRLAWILVGVPEFRR